MPTKNKFYNLKYDRVFKSIIADPSDTRVINKILSDILEDNIEVIEFIPSELPVDNKNSRVNTLDIIAKSSNGLLINIEINTKFDKLTKERNLVYYTSLYNQSILRGRYKCSKVIHIDITFNENYNGKAKRRYCIKDEENDLYSENFEIIVVNIARYKKDWYDGINKHKYLVMLDANEEELEKLSKEDDLIKEVKDKMLVLNDNGTFTRLISREAEMKIMENIRGERKGIKIGEKQGKKEEQYNIAKEMLKRNMKLQDIIDITKLSKKELEKIQVSLK